MYPATITYDRKQRQYAITDTETGEVVETFPAGCKIEAQRYAIALFNPRLARIIQTEILMKRPYLEARAWKAAELVANEAVAPADSDGSPYFAYVRGSGDTYALGQDEDGKLTCTCPDFCGWSAPMTETGQRLCKHLLSWHLFQRLQKRRCYHCQKLNPGELMTCEHCGEEIDPF